MASGAIGLVLGLGGTILTQLLRPKQHTKITFGPRVSDLNIPSISPGNTIQYVWGVMDVPGQMIYCQRLQEHAWIIITYVSSSNILNGSKTPQIEVDYTYSSTVALAWCAGPVQQVNRIWANGKLMWVNPDITQAEIAAEFEAAYYSEQSRLIALGVDATLASCSAYVFALNNYVNPENVNWATIGAGELYVLNHPPTPLGNFNQAAIDPDMQQLFDPILWDVFYTPTMLRYGSITNYIGDENQEPDPVLQSIAGLDAADIPAYRGICYTVIQDFQVGNTGNQVPTFKAEIQATDGQVRLVDIIGDILSMSGLDQSTYNPFAQMDNNIMVDGYAITQNVATRQVLEDMQKVFPFDACEKNYQLQFQSFWQRPCALIRSEDLAAHQSGDPLPDPMELKRAPQIDLPRRINLKYQEKARNFSLNTVWAERFTGSAYTVEDVDVTFALERPQAQAQVEEMLAYRYLNKVSAKIQLPRKYIILDPGDIVYIPNVNNPEQLDMWRIVEMAIGANGLIELTLNYFEYIDNIVSQAGAEPVTIAPVPAVITKTWPFLLDIPLIRDSDSDRPGFYVVLSGSTSTWGGGSLYIDETSSAVVPAFDNTLPPPATGTSFALLASQSFEVAQGVVLTPPVANAIPGVWDMASAVHVLLRDPNFVLSNVNPVDMLTTTANVFCCGSEIIAFCNATNLGNGNWKLTQLVRGLYGTEYAMGSHSVSETFVSLINAQRVVHEASFLNTTDDYIALSFGEAFSNETSFNFTDTGVSLKPRQPWVGACYHPSDGSFILNWEPRNRQNGEWEDGSDITLDQLTEAYSIDVTVGATTKTYSLGAVRTWCYTEAMQTSDFGSAVAHPLFTIYQIGNVIGRGFGSQVQF